MAKIHQETFDLPTSLSDIWKLLNDNQQKIFQERAVVQYFRKNEMIYCERETPKNLMCLLKGKVKICKKGMGSRNQIIRMIKPVQYFGYRAYFAKEPYLTGACAFEGSFVCLIPMKVITRLLEENNKLASFFIKQLSVDLGIADERMVNLSQKHIRGRLAEALLLLIDSYGLEEDNATISIYLSREDLSNLSNMTTSNAIRTLIDFSIEKVIALDGRKIKIIDEKSLRRISKMG